VQPGEVAIEDDHVVAVEVESRRCLKSVVGDVDGHALVAEPFEDDIGQRAGVFNDEHSHTRAPVLAASASGKAITTRRPPSRRA
jgi:hypothetical protein